MINTSLTAADFLFLAQGAGMTILVTAIAVALGTVLGIALGVLRLQVGPWWAAPVTFLLDIFRSIPLLIQLVLVNASTPPPTAPRSSAAPSRRCRPRPAVPPVPSA